MKKGLILVLVCFVYMGCSYTQYSDQFLPFKKGLVGSWKFKDSAMGPQVLTFSKSMTYELDFEGDGTKDIWGSYTVFDWTNQLKLTDEGGAMAEDCRSPGVYLYDISGDEIRYTLVADPCSFRTQAMAVAWQRIGK